MAFVETIINAALAQAEYKSSLAQSYGEIAIAAATGSASYTPAEVGEQSVNEPNVFIPSRASGIDFTVFDSMYHGIIEDLSDRFSGMMTEYFSIDPNLLPEAEAWMKRAIVDGGTGINASVENQIWQRDRDRIGTEASAAMDEAAAQRAAGGYPMPPGAHFATLQAIQRKRSADAAAVSREAAIKAFETETENVKFAITSAIDYRTKALGAAGDYIRALAVAPNIAASMSTQSADAQARLISSAAGFFNARISAKELILKSQLANQGTQLQAAKMIIDNGTQFADMRVKAVLAVTDNIGRQAAAALNGINATSQLIEAAG